MLVYSKQMGCILKVESFMTRKFVHNDCFTIDVKDRHKQSFSSGRYISFDYARNALERIRDDIASGKLIITID